jgi:hypothetical protein
MLLLLQDARKNTYSYSNSNTPDTGALLKKNCDQQCEISQGKLNDKLSPRMVISN